MSNHARDFDLCALRGICACGLRVATGRSVAKHSRYAQCRPVWQLEQRHCNEPFFRIPLFYYNYNLHTCHEPESELELRI